MRDCNALDLLITPYVDNELSEAHRLSVAEHLRECPTCRSQVDAQATASQLLRAHASVARTMGITPPWRPRAWRLGRPTLAMARAAILVLIGVSVWAVALWLQPRDVLAVGIISDSICPRVHVDPNRALGGDRGCTLRCIATGAKFVLISDGVVREIGNQDFSGLADFAATQVAVMGSIHNQMITISEIAPVIADTRPAD